MLFRSVNMRVRLIKDDGTITVLSAVKTVEGEATAVADGWYTIKVGQWIYGTALVYDMSDYLDGIVTVVVEQDQNETAEGTTCTMWLNKVEFVPLANYSEYNELKQQIIDADYKTEEYTEESYANFATEWQKFNSLSLKLSVEEQSVVDEAVAHMRTAVEGLTKPAEPTLQQEFCGFDNAQWKSMKRMVPLRGVRIPKMQTHGDCAEMRKLRPNGRFTATIWKGFLYPFLTWRQTKTPFRMVLPTLYWLTKSM